MKCKKCGKDVVGNHKFCSKECYWESLKGIKGDKAPNYKKVVGKCQVHRWLDVHYGKPSICESVDCRHNSNFYDWALKTGKKYERKRENFLRMCRSCHRKYDFNDDKKVKAVKNLWWFKKIPNPAKKGGKCEICGGQYYCINLCKIHYEKHYWKIRKARMGGTV